MSSLTNILLFIVLLGTLVLVHEFGHYAAAKLFGVKVLTFSLGFGPRLLGFKWGETEYQIAALPLGGYVKMAGDDPTEPLPEADKGRGFLEQKPWKRAVIALAGPLMNLLFPMLAYFAAFSMVTMEYEPLVASVFPGQPAFAAGIRPGDRITSVAGRPIRCFSELQETIRERAGIPTEIGYRRGGEELTVTLTPGSYEEKNILGKSTRGVIGIGLTARAPIVAILGSEASSPAFAAGIRNFDRIVAVQGKPVTSYPGLVEALGAAMASAESSDKGVAVLAAREELLGGAAGAATFWRTFETVIHPRAELIRQERPENQDVLTPAERAFGIAWDENVLFNVREGTPAWEAGLRRGDRIVAVDGKQILTSMEFAQMRTRIGEGEMRVSYVRDGKTHECTVLQKKVIKRDEFDNEHEILLLGANPDFRPEGYAKIGKVPFRRTLPEAFSKAAGTLPRDIGQTLQSLWMLASRKLSARNLGGPVAIYHVTSQAAEAEESGIALLRLMGFLSINLGLLNLMPIPILDGFHIFSAAMEAVRRRPLSEKAQNALAWLGLFCLLSLMLLAFWNDMVNFVFR